MMECWFCVSSHGNTNYDMKNKNRIPDRTNDRILDRAQNNITDKVPDKMQYKMLGRDKQNINKDTSTGICIWKITRQDKMQGNGNVTRISINNGNVSSSEKKPDQKHPNEASNFNTGAQNINSTYSPNYWNVRNYYMLVFQD